MTCKWFKNTWNILITMPFLLYLDLNTFQLARLYASHQFKQDALLYNILSYIPIIICIVVYILLPLRMWFRCVMTDDIGLL